MAQVMATLHPKSDNVSLQSPQPYSITSNLSDGVFVGSKCIFSSKRSSKRERDIGAQRSGTEKLCYICLNHLVQQKEEVTPKCFCYYIFTYCFFSEKDNPFCVRKYNQWSRLAICWCWVSNNLLNLHIFFEKIAHSYMHDTLDKDNTLAKRTYYNTIKISKWFGAVYI